jgi:hypothetical protein
MPSSRNVKVLSQIKAEEFASSYTPPHARNSLGSPYQFNNNAYLHRSQDSRPSFMINKNKPKQETPQDMYYTASTMRDNE